MYVGMRTCIREKVEISRPGTAGRLCCQAALLICPCSRPCIPPCQGGPSISQSHIHPPLAEPLPTTEDNKVVRRREFGHGDETIAC